MQALRWDGNRHRLHCSPGTLKLRGLDMRVLQILGAILILGGLFVLIKSPSYSSEKSVLKIGDVEAKVSQEHAIPPWAGGPPFAPAASPLVIAHPHPYPYEPT